MVLLELGSVQKLPSLSSPGAMKLGRGWGSSRYAQRFGKVPLSLRLLPVGETDWVTRLGFSRSSSECEFHSGPRSGLSRKLIKGWGGVGNPQPHAPPRRKSWGEGSFLADSPAGEGPGGTTAPPAFPKQDFPTARGLQPPAPPASYRRGKGWGGGRPLQGNGGGLVLPREKPPGRRAPPAGRPGRDREGRGGAAAGGLLPAVSGGREAGRKAGE